MKRLLAVLALASLFGLPNRLPADEVPQLEFLRELRGRYPELAEEYLNKLRQSNPPPEIAAVLPLELAKILLDKASAEESGSTRLELYNKARAGFEEFISKNANSPLVGDARLAVARVTVLQGKTQLSRALMQQEMALREKDALAARQKFLEANAQLTAAADLLDKQVDKLPEPKTPAERAAKRALEEAQFQAHMDLGLNFLDQAETYVNETSNDVLLARSKVIGQAQPILDRVAKDADQNHPSIGWQARAWSGFCENLNGAPGTAMRKLDEVLARNEPAAAAGKRLALFFKLRILLEPPAAPKQADVAQARKDAETWVSDYRNYLKTPEGCGVRYYLADVLFRQAGELKDKIARNQQLNKARDLCQELTRSENDYAEKARVLSIRIVSAEGGFEKEISKLLNFEECLVRAEYEAVQIDAFAKKPDVKPEDVDKERRTRIGNAIEALDRALEFAKKPGSKVSAGEVSKARSMLCGYYLFSGKHKEAIAVGEEAARALPATSQSARTAMYVLEAYWEYINKSTQEGTATLADLDKDGFTARMNDLALMVEQRWPNEQAGDVARHMRGLLLIKQKKQAEAIDVLSRVTPGYTALIFVKNALAMTAFQAAEDKSALAKAEPDKTRKEQLLKDEAQLNRLAVESLKSMPALPPGADSLTTAVFLNAKVALGRAYNRNKEYAEVEKLIDPLLAGIQNGQYKMDAFQGEPDKPSPLEQARSSLVLTKLLAKYYTADGEFAAGHMAKVKEITDPVVKEINNGGYKELTTQPTLRWGLMGLALRASIQEGNTARALEILQAVQKFAAADGGDAGSKGVLMQLALMVKDQVREVRKKKDKDTLKKAIDNFTTFLDELRKGQKAPTVDFLRVMGEAYAALEKHDTAVELLRQVPEPRGDDAKDEKKAGVYLFCRLLIVKELRRGGKLDEAKAELDEVQKLPKGKEHPEAIKEGIHLIEDRGQPYKAFIEWSKLVNQLAKKVQDPGMKEQYFECYYFMTEAWLKHAQALPAGAKRDDGVKRAANFIVKLEGPWPDLGNEESKARFTDLLEREPALKEQYDKLKGQ